MTRTNRNDLGIRRPPILTLHCVPVIRHLLDNASSSRGVTFDKHFPEPERAQILGRLPSIRSILADQRRCRPLKDEVYLLERLVY